MARTWDANTANFLSLGSAIVSSYPWSMSIWFKRNVASGTQYLFSIADSGVSNDDYWYMRINGSHEIQFAANTSRATTVNTASDTTTWHHALGIASADNSRTSILDGDTANKGTDTGAVSPTPDRTAIGMLYDSTPAAPWDGLIAHVCIWNIALADADSVTLYNSGVVQEPWAVEPQAIVAYWPLFDSDGNMDWAGGNDLTLNGTLVYAQQPPLILPLSPGHFERQAAAPGGRTTNNIHSMRLGLRQGMRLGMAK